MAIRYLEGLNKVDTSSSGTGNLVRELKKIRRDINIVAEEAKEPERNWQTKGSPYLPDRKDFDPTIVYGSDRETDWQKVAISGDAERAEALEEYNNQRAKMLQDYNKKKLDII